MCYRALISAHDLLDIHLESMQQSLLIVAVFLMFETVSEILMTGDVAVQTPGGMKNTVLTVAASELKLF